jgi:hypothetical protein
MNAMENSAEVTRIVNEIEAWIARKRRPTRMQARAALIAIGEELLAEREAAVLEPLARWKAIIERQQDVWERLIEEELRLAVGEHVQSCDPRFLGHPRYDFDYTVAARHRIEARLRCAERIEYAPNEALLEELMRADERLEPYLKRSRE